MKSGFVYLIGAGPGDPGLISQKAVNILSKADCIIYDYLANQIFVENHTCERIYVGKKGSDHTLTQEGINKLIIQKAKEGKVVARLKGGDPFIFGRGGEEAEELIAENIPFSIVPGISSFYSSPAYAGIPLTHRDYANAFELITGHRRDDGAPDEDINFPEYNPRKTFVFLMGMKNLEYIAGKLVSEKKFPKDMPVGIVSWGTTPRQKVVTGTLSDISDIAKKSGITSPAIIIVGGVVKLREKLRWFDNQPLFGKTIVVTRTRQQASVLKERLLEMGANVIEFPTIEIISKEDQSELTKAILNLKKYNWIIFTSQNAVNIFFDVLKNNGKDSRQLYNNKIAAIGPATVKELNKYFIEPDLMPSEYVAEEIINEMSKIGIKNQHILLPCASEARLTLKEGLEELGAKVDRIHTYDTVIPKDIPDELKEEVKSADLITFTSSSTVNNFFDIVKDSKAKIASIGPVTSKTAEKLGHAPNITASEYTIDGLVASILKFYKGE